MSCHYGTAGCTNQTDTEHECTTAPQEPESVTRARMMQWIAEGVESGFGTPLSGAMCRLLAADYRLAREANGLALLYTIAPLNPTLSRKTAHIRNGCDVCDWYGMASTPSGQHLHADCGPRRAS